MTRWVDDGQAMDAVYQDFSKAFDRVPHERLLRKLESHGIGGKVVRWIGAWLAGRRQRVCIQGASSSWRDVTSGVPQGSVLGPVLFLIYINDLDSGILNHLLKFADDSKLFGKVSNEADQVKMQDDLNRLHIWSQNWQMDFNAEKCVVMHIGKNSSKYAYSINGHVLNSVDHFHHHLHPPPPRPPPPIICTIPSVTSI